ncbi:MAG: flavodoxin family protein [Gammaproteobacteria bacterium]|nr:flavodoxin family protein [Gammaproteobacteria bacterium]MDH5344277.1 flavodoxin family protein [Gammaproteobacteria bacterium]
MARLLFVCHCPSDNTSALRDAAVAAVGTLTMDCLELRVLAPRDAGPADIEWCNGVLIGTTENFGYMAGLIKDFFERIYYPCLESSQGLPVALYIRAGEDGRGTRSSIERITTGLRWKYISNPLILRGKYRPEFADQVGELAMTMAAGLDAGIY